MLKGEKKRSPFIKKRFYQWVTMTIRSSVMRKYKKKTCEAGEREEMAKKTDRKSMCKYA